MSIELKHKQIIIDGKPTLILAAEFHYFRCNFDKWPSRFERMVESGVNAVATYIPWLIHEEHENGIDLDGSTREELNVKYFLELCNTFDLYVILKPGPFVMAEMKNDGIPFWVAKKHPELIPITWDCQKCTTVTLDYLAPNFLKEARKWYSHVMPLISEHMHPKGKVIGIQIDNEIGMLSWVSNNPDLTDTVIEDMRQWLNNTYSSDALKERYPVDLSNPSVSSEAFRSPKEEYVLSFHEDLGHYMQDRISRYVDTLIDYAKSFGVTDVPFFVNIHGTGGGRALMYPIGISQLYKSYHAKSGVMSGSDIYTGNVTHETLPDLYMINTLTDATNGADQPLGSMEFSAGDGNYGNSLSVQYNTSRIDFITRMYIAQGNRLLNYYTFFGGKNYRFDTSLGDCNDRIATTGEEHGYAAPITINNEENYVYPKTRRVIKQMLNFNEVLAQSFEERDPLSYGFIPDYFMTEYRYPKSEKVQDRTQALEYARSYNMWDSVIRALILLNYRFDAQNLQHVAIDVSKTKVLLLPSARYMAGSIQQKIADYLHDGGKVLLYGHIPLYDMEGNKCSILQEAMKIKPLTIRTNPTHLVTHSVIATGWASGRAELHRSYAQTCELLGDGEVLFKLYHNNEACGFDVPVGKGRVIAITTEYRADVDFFKLAMKKLGLEPTVSHDFKQMGIFMTSTKTQDGQRFIHLLNLNDYDKEFMIYEEGQPLFSEKIQLVENEALMLPINVKLSKDVEVVYSTNEILRHSFEDIVIRLTGSHFIMKLNTFKEVTCDDTNVFIKRDADVVTVSKTKRVYGENELLIKLT